MIQDEISISVFRSHWNVLGVTGLSRLSGECPICEKKIWSQEGLDDAYEATRLYDAHIRSDHPDYEGWNRRVSFYYMVPILFFALSVPVVVVTSFSNLPWMILMFSLTEVLVIITVLSEKTRGKERFHRLWLTQHGFISENISPGDLSSRVLLSKILVALGLIALAIGFGLFVLELSSPTHTVVSPENEPLSIRLSLLAGLGWLLFGLGTGSRARIKSLSPRIFMAAIGPGLAVVMGLLAWVFIYGLLTFS